jgi:hypothetical protein
MILTGKNRSTRIKTCPSAIILNTYPTLTGLVSKVVCESPGKGRDFSKKYSEGHRGTKILRCMREFQTDFKTLMCLETNIANSSHCIFY